MVRFSEPSVSSTSAVTVSVREEVLTRRPLREALTNVS